jgi:hypothetical protein
MNGIHDMGGMEGFGPVRPEPNEPPFHSKWEGRALAMNRALGYAKIWNIDKSRAKIEEMPPHEYLTKTYYEKWAQRLEQLLVEYGYIGEDEVKAGRSLRPGKPLPRFLPAVQARRPCANKEHPSAHTYAPPALRAWQDRHRGLRARLPRVSRFHCHRQRRESAVALHRAVRRARAVGRERRSDEQGFDRGVGALS